MSANFEYAAAKYGLKRHDDALSPEGRAREGQKFDWDQRLQGLMEPSAGDKAVVRTFGRSVNRIKKVRANEEFMPVEVIDRMVLIGQRLADQGRILNAVQRQLLRRAMAIFIRCSGDAGVLEQRLYLEMFRAGAQERAGGRVTVHDWCETGWALAQVMGAKLMNAHESEDRPGRLVTVRFVFVDGTKMLLDRAGVTVL